MVLYQLSGRLVELSSVGKANSFLVLWETVILLLLPKTLTHGLDQSPVSLVQFPVLLLVALVIAVVFAWQGSRKFTKF